MARENTLKGVNSLATEALTGLNHQAHARGAAGWPKGTPLAYPERPQRSPHDLHPQSGAVPFGVLWKATDGT